MDEFWKSALKYCGSAALAGLLGWTIYPQVLSSPYLKNLTHGELFGLLCLIVVATFVLCVTLINIGTKSKLHGNNLTMKGSVIHGSVQVGDNNSEKSK
ncbi:hypothetical protein N5D61_16680 [Pseudomonas sp. GD03842]|uniref:hypothetical protein n=1 Tax=Pseudomonas sp. GD03842 TaxID=2975385 RepID=UPI00244755F0|nr:hypothetical protein [Pseudomonas sp. GD03842]MDH0747968.1 hypothetical protein [Pseudomonas sp. GD03842]